MIVDNAPLPLGGEGGPPPALSSAGAGRVRGFLPSCSLSTIRWDTTLVYPWCERVLKRFELPPTVHDHARYRVWNRRGYDMNVWSEKKIHEKLNYMHNNPVKRGLVAQPGDWPWSSWRYHCLKDSSVLTMDRAP
jgi:hypothetical protein